MTPSVLKCGPFHSLCLHGHKSMDVSLPWWKMLLMGKKKRNTNSKNSQPGVNHYIKCYEYCVVCTGEPETLSHVKCKYSIFVCWTDTFWVWKPDNKSPPVLYLLSPVIPHSPKQLLELRTSRCHPVNFQWHDTLATCVQHIQVGIDSSASSSVSRAAQWIEPCHQCHFLLT